MKILTKLWIAVLVVLGARSAFPQQSYSSFGEAYGLCRIWDGSDVLAIDASGNISCLQAGAWTVAATQSGTWNINNISGTISLPTGASTSANQTTEITALQLIDDVPTAMNGAFSKAAPAAGQFDDAATTAATEDNVAPIRITAQRGAHVNLRNASGTEIGTSGAPVRVDPTGTTAQPVTDNAGSLTVDAPASTPVAVRPSTGAAFIDPFNLDLDTGAGTVNRESVGLAAAASGGPIALEGTTANGLEVDVTRVTGTVTVGGTVTANQGTAAAGSGAWPMTVTNTADTVVKPGDAVNNAVRVNVVAGGGAGGTSSTFGAAFPGTGTAAGFTDGTNMQGAVVYDVNGSISTEYVQGVVLRASNVGGASTEAGTTTTPLWVNTKTVSGGSTNASWTSATAVDTTLVYTADDGSLMKASSVAISFNVSGSITAGTINFEGTDDGSNWHAMTALRMNGLTTETSYVLTGGKQLWQVGVEGLTQMRVRLNPAITGAGTATIRISGDIAAPETYTVVAGGALNANQSVNLAQVAGGTTQTGSGTVTGAQRVEIGNNGTGQIASISTSVTPGTAAANLGKAEDAGHTTGDTGVAALGVVREASGTQFANADNDYSAITTDRYGVVSVSRRHPNGFRCTVTVSTATTLTAVGGSCAAPGAGLSLYITGIMFSSSAQAIAADAFPTLKYGTGGACGTGTTVWWGCFMAAATQANCTYYPGTAIKIPANNEICWINSTAGSKFIVIDGFIGP